ncbi:hypothetical protein ABBQ32_006038 [Trebouxia sp. C0010 RCD-2024]
MDISPVTHKIKKDPTSQPALDQLRHTAADLQQHRQQQAATQALRAGVLLHEYGDQSTYYFHHLHRQRQQATVIANLQQQPGSPQVDLCTESGRQQADSIIVSFFSADSPTGMFKQLPTDVPAQQALLSSVDRQLPAEAQQACEGPDEGITLAEPLFLNQQIQLPLSPAATHSANGGMGSRPFTPQDQPLLLAAGITKVAHLQAALQVQHPQALTACLQSLLLALPLPWQAAATAAPTAPPWRQGHSAS